MHALSLLEYTKELCAGCNIVHNSDEFITG